MCKQAGMQISEYLITEAVFKINKPEIIIIYFCRRLPGTAYLPGPKLG